MRMPPVEELAASVLRRRCDAAALGFQTTAEIDASPEPFGQQRALDAARFGFGIRQDGYNVFAMGPAGLGKRTVVSSLLSERAGTEPTPSDWCYVHNFEKPDKPRALALPAGKGRELRRDMESLVETLRAVIPAAFQSEEYQNRMRELQEEFREAREEPMTALAKEAAERGIRMLRTPAGFAFAPTKNGDVLSPEEFEKLSADEQDQVKRTIESLQDRMQEALRELLRFGERMREKAKALNREVTLSAVGHAIAHLRDAYRELPEVVKYLDAVEADVVEHAADFQQEGEQESPLAGLPMFDRGRALVRYRVNLLVDHAGTKGAPVVYEEHPTYQNLVGRVEHRAQFGALQTDFSLVKAGALHRANGGYLILDARKVLTQPFAWEGLKSALRTMEIRIESLGEALSLVSTVSLEPEHIPLRAKVALIGDRYVYYLLYEADPEFADLFKVAADFEEVIDRSTETTLAYARRVAAVVRQCRLKHFTSAAVARLVDAGAREVGDAEKLSAVTRWLSDLAREADYWAGQAGRTLVGEEDVERAVDAKIERGSRMRQLVHEAIRRGTVLIDTTGTKIGQVNGLSVLALGDFSFGQPSRITATARVGRGQVIDIEREVKLGGAYHSKGVLILSSFFAQRYARDRSLALNASLVFEQSYGRVDGDSASVAELCALLSALAGLPIRQSIAITGSVNQHGAVQAIGGVNEKIEGFYDVCVARGLTGDQGVIIPASNVKHLMLRSDIVAAVAAGRFHVWSVDSVDDAVELLMGMPAGAPDEKGEYPTDTVNRKVSDELARLAKLQKELEGGPRKAADDTGSAEAAADVGKDS
jgi:lon-related putative ATP-dependent protease